jgi:hypothetical protein
MENILKVIIDLILSFFAVLLWIFVESIRSVLNWFYYNIFGGNDPFHITRFHVYKMYSLSIIVYALSVWGYFKLIAAASHFGVRLRYKKHIKQVYRNLRDDRKKEDAAHFRKCGRHLYKEF